MYVFLLSKPLKVDIYSLYVLYLSSTIELTADQMSNSYFIIEMNKNDLNLGWFCKRRN